MFEIYNTKTDKVILSGLTYKQASALRMTWVDLWDLKIRPMSKEDNPQPRQEEE